MDYDSFNKARAGKIWRAGWTKAQISDLDQQIATQELFVQEMTKEKSQLLANTESALADTTSYQVANEMDAENEDSAGTSSRTLPIPAYFFKKRDLVSRKSRILPPSKPLNPFFHDFLSFPEGLGVLIRKFLEFSRH